MFIRQEVRITDVAHSLVRANRGRHGRRCIKPLLVSPLVSRDIVGGGGVLVRVLMLMRVRVRVRVLVLVHWRQWEWRWELERLVRCRRHGCGRVTPALRTVGWVAAVRAMGRVRLRAGAVWRMIYAVDHRSAGHLRCPCRISRRLLRERRSSMASAERGMYRRRWVCWIRPSIR